MVNHDVDLHAAPTDDLLMSMLRLLSKVPPETSLPAWNVQLDISVISAALNKVLQSCYTGFLWESRGTP